MPYPAPRLPHHLARRAVALAALALSALSLLLLGCAEPAQPASGTHHVTASAHGDGPPSCDTRQGEAATPGGQRTPRPPGQNEPERGPVPVPPSPRTGSLNPGHVPARPEGNPLLATGRWRI
ncbi:hypothetical protein I3F58_24385 [Streptomyces sp. MUM 203J]|nr:hypothetical protein [Streptomyces sp. MUM 203J]